MPTRKRGRIKSYTQLNRETDAHIRDINNISAHRSQIVGQLNKIMDDVRKTGRSLTAQEQTLITGASAELTSLNEQEQDITTKLGKVKGVRDKLADESIRNIERLLQSVDQALGTQGAGALTILAAALKETKILLVDVNRHNDRYYDHQIGKSSLSESQGKAVRRISKKLHDHNIGLTL